MLSPKIASQIVSVSLLLGGIFGFGMQIYFLGIPAANGNLNSWSLLSLVVFVVLFLLCMFAGWRLWRDGRDWRDLGKILLALQVLSFSYDGFGYSFYSGFQFIAGWSGTQLGVRFDFGSWGFLMISGSDQQLRLTVNLAAVAMLVTLENLDVLKGPQAE